VVDILSLVQELLSGLGVTAAAGDQKGRIAFPDKFANPSESLCLIVGRRGT